MPARSAGPFLTTFCTWMVSLRMVNSMPTPEKEPFSSSLAACTSLALMYTECGSSSASICGMAFSTSPFMLTVSTYWSSIMCSRLLSLLLLELMMLSLLPEKRFA